jgi:cytochrome c
MRRALPALGFLVIAALALDALRPASGDAAEDALAAAVRRGGELWRERWNPEGKSCADCHARGPNQMRVSRVRTWPKYDKVLGRVGNIQQKINQMIRVQGKAEPLELGSDDLNALEAYLVTLK